MSVEVRSDVILLGGDCAVEEAETLVAALLERPRPVDISQCRHLHGALAQGLISLGAEVVGEPADPFLRDRLAPNLRARDAQTSLG